MFRLSIRRKILGIAVGLIVLMGVATIVSLAMVTQVGKRLEELTESYVPAYGNLARANIRSLERAIALRRIVIERLQARDSDGAADALRQVFDAKGKEVEAEARQARAALAALIAKASDTQAATALARLDGRIDAAMTDSRRHLTAENERLLAMLKTADARAIAQQLERVDALRDELTQKIDAIRADMLALLRAEAAATVAKQQQVTAIAIALTVIATVLGLTFAFLVSGGMTRPVRRLLEGTQAIESGRLEEKIVVTTQDEIGALTAAFNRMSEQLKMKERLRETFGKYVDPRVVEGLIRQHGGVIDKYIGDAVMAYWGPPFTGEDEHAALAVRTALAMLARVEPFRAELPELLGLRSVPIDFDIRIGIATGEAIVGSIGSDLMMSYTVMGDTVNSASRLEGANRAYGSRTLLSAATVEAARDIAETREIDRVALYGQSAPHAIFDILAAKGAPTPAQATLRDRYAEGLAAYRARNWDAARHGFRAALDAVPADGPSKAMLARVDAWATSPPGADWDGAWRFERK